MARYYHKMGSTITEEFGSHHAASKRMTERFINDPDLRPGDIAILLDVGSIGRETRSEMAALLQSDPALHAVFTLGRNFGYEMQAVQPGLTGLVCVDCGHASLADPTHHTYCDCTTCDVPN